MTFFEAGNIFKQAYIKRVQYGAQIVYNKALFIALLY